MFNGSHDLNRPLSGTVCRPYRLGVVTVSTVLYTVIPRANENVYCLDVIYFSTASYLLSQCGCDIHA